MKTINLSVILLFFSISLFSQSPQLINYQAVARDASGELLTETIIGIRINILSGSPTGTGNTVYQELHIQQTSPNGLFNLQIGGGTPVNQSFDQIDWSKGTYFLQIEIDEEGGSNYKMVGTSQFLSVPYALYAEQAGNVPDTVTVIRETETILRDTVRLVTETETILRDTVRILTETETILRDTVRILTEKETILRDTVRLLTETIIRDTVRLMTETIIRDTVRLMTETILRDTVRLLTETILRDTVRLLTEKETIIRDTVRILTDSIFEKQWSEGENTFYTQRRVGLGTNQPDYPFHVKGRSNITEGRIFQYIENTSDDTHSTASLFLSSGTGDNFSSVSLSSLGKSYIALPDYAGYGLLSSGAESPGVVIRANRSDADIRFVSGGFRLDSEKFRISPNGILRAINSDIFIENAQNGVIMKSPNGNCWRMSVSNLGQPVFTLINCPD
ncbi:MAG: hypothetical protein AAFO07_22805 [Bacteroidota bacterium]